MRDVEASKCILGGLKELGVRLAAGDAGVIAAVAIAMGTTLKYRLVAQGVEAQSQVDFLNARSCNDGQGYFFGGPLAAAEFRSRLQLPAGHC